MRNRVLIIEDNDTYSAVLSQKLTKEKFEVVVARDGQEGLDKAIDCRPDIILVDLLLPKFNGIKVIEELRKNDVLRQVPFLILTNLNPDQELINTIEINKNTNYLIKPQVTLNEITDKIRLLLDDRSTQ